MKISVIIVNYNVKYFLEQCLHSVLKACEGIGSEIIVVDNNSADNSAEMVGQKFPSVILIENKTNDGFSKANNQGIRRAKGAYILLLNPDTVVEEDTFKKITGFMDAHPEAGALGVKMLDGSGKFLPESKRGLPTPAVAFFKITGLAALFPKSKTFGKYHLGFLDKDKIHEVDVLAGAFMLLRKSALDKTGLLDETFFMYGEDIDLSYRITQAGYKNYYFPDTRIIHYKGESTKKSGVNYVLVFYNAMIIFAKKHFAKSRRMGTALFTVIIRAAIYIRAGAAIASRVLKRIFLPLLDFSFIYTGMYFLKEYWSESTFVQYPSEFMQLAVPAYALLWILSIYFSGGYDAPIRLRKIVRGLVSGTLLILVVYALLPESYRFSRALILLGFVWASISIIALRFILNLLRIGLARRFSDSLLKPFALESSSRKKLLIMGEEDEANRVLSLLKMSETTHNFIGFVRPVSANYSSSKAATVTLTKTETIPMTDSFGHRFNLGTFESNGSSAIGNGVGKFKDLIAVYNIDEVIFCARDVASNHIINYMSAATGREVEYKIAPPGSMFIIGSNSINNSGELYAIDTNSISKWVNRRNKRLLDIGLAILFLLTSPLLIFFQKNPSGFFKNIFAVLAGNCSWVGYAGTAHSSLPKIKRGILTPIDIYSSINLDPSTINRLNALYAKDYDVYMDLNIIFRSLRNLGR